MTKKIMTYFRTMSVAFLASATLAACSSSDDSIIDEQPVVTPTAPTTYTMTVQATKGDETTRGLYFDSDGALNTKWYEGEEVEVMQDQGDFISLGTLTAAASDNGTTTLTGTLHTAPVSDMNLLFYLHGSVRSYTGQTGVLLEDDNSIEKKYDYATATADKGEFTVDTETKTVTIQNGLTFLSEQAIVKFILFNALTNQALEAKSLTLNGVRKPGTVEVENICLEVKMGESGLKSTCGELTINPETATNEFYVALKQEYGACIKFRVSAKDEAGNEYYYDAENVNFTEGTFYEVNVKMRPVKIDLSQLTENFTARNEEILTGTLANNVKVSIADGATVTLRDVTIEGVEGEYEYTKIYNWAGITCEGDATIVLEGNNTLKGFEEEYPGVYVPEGKTLTIKGDGNLNASSNGHGAGIGGGNKIACGNILIKGGNIIATGGRACTGIGGAGFGDCGNITITGGTIVATGGQSAAGIGAGDDAKCGNITISKDVTKVEAIRNYLARSCIGISNTSSCGVITIGDVEYYDGTNYASEELEKALKADSFIYPSN